VKQQRFEFVLKELKLPEIKRHEGFFKKRFCSSHLCFSSTGSECGLAVSVFMREIVRNRFVIRMA
jgi:hypothetical protein